MKMKLGTLLEETGGSIKTGPFGTALKAAEYSENGVPLISVGEIGDGRLAIGSKTPRVSEETTDRLSEYILRSGDVVMGRKGAVERSALIKDDQDGYFLGSDGIRVRFGDSINSTFMAYQFRSDAVRRWLISHASGTTMASMNQAILSKLPILVSPIRTQQAIAEVLGALDDKIAANERILDLRQQFTRSIYRSAPKPRTKPLSSVASFINGRAFTKNATGTGRVVIRIAELNSGVGTSTVWNDIDVDKSNTAQPGDLLFAWSGSLTVARWFEPEAIVNQHIFKVETSDGTPMWLVRELLNEQLERFKSIAADKATTMGHIKRSHLDEPVPIPNDDWLIAHQDVMSSMWDLELELELEKRRLARTRDELLPLLMSGKITVKDAEAVVSDAV